MKMAIKARTAKDIVQATLAQLKAMMALFEGPLKNGYAPGLESCGIRSSSAFATLRSLPSSK